MRDTAQLRHEIHALIQYIEISIHLLFSDLHD